MPPASANIATITTTLKDWESDQEVRWCPGCGDYAILKAVQRTLPQLGADPANTVFVSGIGCSSRFPYYMASYGFHTIHGRAPAVATGIKIARPDLTVRPQDDPEQVVSLAVEIAREGREGRKIGTLFVVGDSGEVMRRSKPMILDPLQGHPEEDRRIEDPNVRETIKELAQLDGAFVVSNAGVVLSAARYIDAASGSLDVPLGLGSRHMAGASISRQTDAVAVVVSESSMVRMFDDGELVSEIVPELWMIEGYRSRLEGRTETRQEEDVTVISRAD